MLPEESDEIQAILETVTSDVEQALSMEDKGWIKLGDSQNNLDLTGNNRINAVKRSRWYAHMDPLAKQALRLWIDYTFGNGISYRSNDERVQKVLDSFWHNPANRKILNAQGQRQSCRKLLVDGEIFFALFLGTAGQATIRRIDPLEITEIITDPDDSESEMYFKREWSNQQGAQNVSYYRSVNNKDDRETPDSAHKMIKSTEDALVYHVTFESLGQRGDPILLPVLDWIDQYRRFLASRIAIVRSLARFAWKNKIMGGPTAVAAAKSVETGQYPQAGSTWIENQGADRQPIKTDTGAANAKDDGRMIKLQICAGVGISEQYFGDIATGNLATAKTVELPMLKQFGSFQQLWSDVYQDIHDVVLTHNGVSEDDRFVDLDFPEIAPADALAALTAIQGLVTAFPQAADIPDVLKQALLNIGLNNVDEILSNLESQAKDQAKDQAKEGKSYTALIKAIRSLRESIEKEKQGEV